MDMEGGGDLFKELFGTKSLASPRRPPPPLCAEAVDFDAMSGDSDDEFSLPDAPFRPTPPPPATEKSKHPTQVEGAAVDEGEGATGVRGANVSHVLSGFKKSSVCRFELDLRAQRLFFLQQDVSQRLGE